MSRGIVLLCCSLLLTDRSPLTAAPPSRGGPQKDGIPTEARLDRHGDPLPNRALVRIGTARLRWPDNFASAAFSANGDTVAAAGYYQGALTFWDAATGRRKEVVQFKDERATRVAFSREGRKLAVARLSGLWVRDLAINDRPITLPCPWVRAMAFSPDGGKLAASRGDAISLWDIDKKAVRHRLHDSGHFVFTMAFSPDGTLLASGGNGIRLWDASAGTLLASLEGHEQGVNGLAFSSDSKTLISGGEEGTLRFWDVAGRRQLRRTLTCRVRVFASSPNGKVLAMSDQSEKVQLWDAHEVKLLREIDNEVSVLFLAFSPDGSKLLAGGGGHALRLWDVQTGKEALPFDAPLREVVTVAFSPDGRSLAFYAGHAIRTWDSVTGRSLLPLERGASLNPQGANRDYYPGAVLRFTADGKHLAAMDQDPGGGGGPVTWRIHLWDAMSHQKRATLHDPRFRSNAFAVAPDNDTIAVPGLGGTFLWSLSAQKQIRIFTSNDFLRMRGGEDRLMSDGRVAFSPDGRTLACTGLKGIRLRDWQKGTLLRTISGEWLSAGFMAFSPDGKLLATCQGSSISGREPDTKIQFWEVATGTRAFAIDAGDGLNGIAFSPDGRLLATAPYKDKTVRVWSVYTGKEVAAFEGHEGPICSVAFSPDGKRLASGSTDTTALIWSLEGIDAPLPRTDPSPKDIDALWAALRAPKAETAYPAIWSLAGAGDKAVPFLTARVSPAPDLIDKRTARLLADLDSNDFATREAAAAELTRMGQAVAPTLRKTLEGNPSADLRKRLQTILEGIGTGSPPAETLQQLRAVVVLELVGSPKARDVLKKLASGAADSDLTRDAKAALLRLERRPPQP